MLYSFTLLRCQARDLSSSLHKPSCILSTKPTSSN